eukprot:5835950-Amphidinium_carterae.1
MPHGPNKLMNATLGSIAVYDGAVSVPHTHSGKDIRNKRAWFSVYRVYRDSGTQQCRASHAPSN